MTQRMRDAVNEDVEFIVNNYRGIPKQVALDMIDQNLTQMNDGSWITDYSPVELSYLRGVWTKVRARVEEWPDNG